MIALSQSVTQEDLVRGLLRCQKINLVQGEVPFESVENLGPSVLRVEWVLDNATPEIFEK